MSYRVSGVLRNPDGTPCTGCELQFTSRKNFSPLLTGVGSTITTDESGAYDVALEYGAYAVTMRTKSTYNTAIGQIDVAADTVVGQDLPSLLQQSGWMPATPEYIKQINDWLSEASSSATSSKGSAMAAKVSETNAKSSENAALSSKNSAASSASMATSAASSATGSAHAAANSEEAAIFAASHSESSASNAKNSEEGASLSKGLAESYATASSEHADAALKHAEYSAASSEAAEREYNRAKQQADMAQFEADRASKISGLDTVTDAISLASVPFPDVWMPLSDNLRMLSGYGEEIKVGDEVVANKVSFSRASGATYINKAGDLVEAGPNAPRFEKEGLLIEGQSTNLVYANGTSGLYSGNGLTKTYDATTNTVIFRETDDLRGHYAEHSMSGLSVSNGVITYSGYFDLSAIGNREIWIDVYDYSSGSHTDVGRFKWKNPTSSDEMVTDGNLFASDYKIKRGVDGLTKFECSYNWGSEITALRIRITLINGSTTYQGDSAVGIAVRNIQIEALPFASSYIPTNGAAATRAGDNLTIPRLNNECVEWYSGADPITPAITSDAIALVSPEGKQHLRNVRGFFTKLTTEQKASLR